MRFQWGRAVAERIAVFDILSLHGVSLVEDWISQGDAVLLIDEEPGRDYFDPEQ